MAKRRKRGDGGISLRKDGRWEGRAVVGYDEKGLPVTKNVLAKTKAECAAKLKQLRDSIAAPAQEQPKPGILLKDWLDHWYQGYKKPMLRPNTQMSYERRIYQHIIPALGNIQMDMVSIPSSSASLLFSSCASVSLRRPSAPVCSSPAVFPSGPLSRCPRRYCPLSRWRYWLPSS